MSTEPVTSESADSYGSFSEHRKTATTRISDFTVPPGTPFQTPEGLRAEDEPCRIAFDAQGGVYPIRESVFVASYAPASDPQADSQPPTPDPRQGHGESGLFRHEPGEPCVVCDQPDSQPPTSEPDLRAWLIEQAEQAKTSAEHPQTWPDEAMKDRGVRHMAEATLTWLGEHPASQEAADRTPPTLDADRHLPDCDAPGPDEPCTCVSRAETLGFTPDYTMADLTAAAVATLRAAALDMPGHWLSQRHRRRLLEAAEDVPEAADRTPPTHDERTCPDCSRVIEETGGNYLSSLRTTPEPPDVDIDLLTLAEAIRLWYVETGRNPVTKNWDQPQADWLIAKYTALRSRR